jgi:hypothetical protein
MREERSGHETRCAEGNERAHDWEAFLRKAESEIASFINEHFGLEPDPSSLAV